MKYKQNAKLRINFLRTQIREHNFNYYVNSSPTISDYSFDMLLNELIDLEKKFPEFFDENSPTARVGNDSNNKFEQSEHKFPMLSLGNTYNFEELLDFDNRIKKIVGENFLYCCELKFDGVSISLTYEQGKLLKAVTRGDGTKGDIVTENVKTITSIPLILRGNDFPELFEIRGEIFMPHKSFITLNKIRQKTGKQLFANPRNAAAGSIKMLNSKEVAKRKLDCFLYYAISNDFLTNSHFENLQRAKTWGFKISDKTKRLKNITEVFEYIKYWETARTTLNYDIDGIVIKIDDTNFQQTLGMTSKSPRWTISYKFKAERVATKLLSVDFQVGRTGTITPVANLKPVLLAGTTVKRSTLHNADYISELNLHYNDTVFVEKAGEIIPQIVGIDLNKRIEKSTPVAFPEICPACKTKLQRNKTEAAFYCTNTNCPPQIKAKIEHFISRKAMNIAAGDATIEALFDASIVKNSADLYYITFNEIVNIDNFAEKSAQNLINSIELSKNVPFERVLYALGIRYVGETISKIIAKNFKNIDNIIAAKYNELTQVNEIGDKIAQEIVNFFANKSNLQIIERLKKAELKFEIETEIETEQFLDGLKIVVTGNFGTSLKRKEIEKLIEKFGGKKVSSVSSKTNLIIAGEKAGSSKIKKAQELGVKIISENDFFDMINTKK